MRRSKEIVILILLFVGAAAFVLGYVIDRRAKNRAATRPVKVQPAEPNAQLGPLAP